MASLGLTTARNASGHREALAQETRILCVLFFFSGFPALIYQLTWQRALFLIFGVNIESVTIVVTAFMLGLGVGSLVGGWLSKQRAVPLLLLLASIEILTGAFGFVSLMLFGAVGDFTIGLTLPMTAAAALALVIVPTLLMGATLPLLVGHLGRRSGNIGSAVGLLYYVNTLGAGAACLASALMLFPFLGMSGSIYAAVAMNGAVALAALAAQWFGHPESESVIRDCASGLPNRRPVLSLGPVLILAAAGGFVSLSYEIFFFRTISYASGSSAPAFAVTLSAFLVGIASGSRQAGEHCKTATQVETKRRLVDTLLTASVLGALFLPLLNHLSWLDRGVVGVGMLMVYLVARFWGSVLPYLAELSIAADMVAIPHWSEHVLENLQWKGMAAAGNFVDVVENRSGIITVTDDGTAYGHGMYDGRFNTDLKKDSNGIVRPYALSLFHPAPRNVLMIGLSSGSWAQVIASNPNVASLTIVEINPGYLALIAKEPEVASVLSNPKVTIITDDGRRWLRANPERHFDAIVSNTTWHFRASVTNLLSVEFLDIVRRHLNPGGIFFYNTTDSDRVQRTGCLAFEYGARFTNHMVVSNEPIAWDFRRWRQTLESYRIDGVSVFDTSRAQDRVMLAQFESWRESITSKNARVDERPIEPCPDLLTRTAGKRPVTDDNMGSEWRHVMGLD